MAEYKRVLSLVLIMTTLVVVSTGTAIKVLYDTAFERERLHLIETVHSHARMMEAAAGFQRSFTPDLAGAPDLALVTHISDAHVHYRGNAETGEFTLARLAGDYMVFLFAHRHGESRVPEPVPFASKLAEPMRRALSGESGSLIGVDYRGVQVLAAYEPVDIVDLGIVAKIDLAEIREPFLRAAGLVIGLALLLIVGGTVVFLRVGNPMVRHIRESEHRYQRIFNGALVAIWEQDFSEVTATLEDLREAGVSELRPYLGEDPQTAQRLLGRVRIKDVNPATLHLFGARSRDELVSWFTQAFIPGARDVFIDQLCAIWERRDAFRARVAVPSTVDGREILVALSMLIPDTPEGFTAVPVSVLDVSKDAILRHREQQLALILSSTGEGIFGMDPRGRCTFANRSTVKTLGFREESDLLGADMHALIHHTRVDGAPHLREDCPIIQALCQDTVVHLEDEILWRADGTGFPADYWSYPMVRDGVVVGTVATFLDITERKQKDAELRQAQKMDVLGKLTGGVAHDFNNLLTVILGNLHLLEQGAGEGADAETRELIADARSAAKDGAELTRRLLAFSRKQDLEPRRTDINAFLADATRVLRRVIGADIQLAFNPGPPSLSAFVDPHQLRNALLNLVINARDAMPAGGTVTIETSRRRFDVENTGYRRLAPGNYVMVQVRDTGTGMSPETLQRAVEPFYTTKGPGRGSGLGLSTAYGFAEQSGGGLTLASEPGRGTLVSLFLPEMDAVSGDSQSGGGGTPR